LAAFGVGGGRTRFTWENSRLGRLVLLAGGLRRRHWRCRHTSVTTPDKHLPVLVDRALLDLNEFALQILVPDSKALL
jgi:hypothetical protein